MQFIQCVHYCWITSPLLLAKILVVNRCHRQNVYRDLIAYLQKNYDKVVINLEKNHKKKGAMAAAQVLICQTLIVNTGSQSDGLGSWLGAFYDDSMCCPILILQLLTHITAAS